MFTNYKVRDIDLVLNTVLGKKDQHDEFCEIVDSHLSHPLVIELPDLGDIELPDLGDIELPDLEEIDLPETENIELPDLGVIENPEFWDPELIDIPNLDQMNDPFCRQIYLSKMDPNDLTSKILKDSIQSPFYAKLRAPLSPLYEFQYEYECFSIEEENEIVSFILSRSTNRHGKKALYTRDLENYIQARSKDAKEADDAFLKQLCNIQSYEFHPMKLKPKAIIYKNGEKFPFIQTKLQLKAVIDFLKLEFLSNVKTTRFKVKEILTKKTGTKHYIQPDESGIVENGSSKFTITLHDVNDSKELKKIVSLLIKHFKADVKDMRITNIELSLDFYKAQNNALLVALFKSLRLKEESSNFRMYRNSKGTFSNIELDPVTLVQNIDDGWCIGINHRDSDLFYRLYHKTTDRNQVLDPIYHRHRVEVNLKGDALNSIDCHPYNLSAIIKYGFKYIQFTKPTNNATANDKQNYTETVKPYGLEHLVYSARNHRKRTLLPYLRPHSDLNLLARKAVDNLCRKF